MKANQKCARLLSKDTRGAVGIGTMIVFIATILVAATAAAVLIDTSGKLQEKSQQTGSETTKQVASNLLVKGVFGTRPGTTATDYIDWLNITVSLAPGADAVDLSELIIRIGDGTTVVEADYVNGAADADSFNASELRDDDSSWTAAAPVMTAGDLINIKFDTDAMSMNFQPRTEVRITLVPEVGAQVRSDFTTPQTYGTDTIIILR